MNRFFPLLAGLVFTFSVHAQGVPLNLDTAIERALQHDPRISEMEALVRVAEATLAEVDGYGGLQSQVYSFVGLSPGLTGGLFLSDNCGDQAACVNRRDRYTLAEGISPWSYTDFRIIKPLYTFGKLENYRDAAGADIKIKQQTVRLQKGDTVYEVKKAYFGFLAARDTELFLEDMKSRLQIAADKVKNWLDEGEGHVKQSDLFALQAALGLADAYISKAQALKKIAMAGLKVLTNFGAEESIEIQDTRITPVALPGGELAEWQGKALTQRPEMNQLREGLKAKQSLVLANKAMNKPNIVAGLGGMVSFSPGRDRLDNPHIYDPFNDWGGTPFVGLQWDWNGGLKDARVAKAQAELDALMEKGALARKGIPFQVEESYKQVHAFYSSVASLEKSARSARRWMISTYTDFEAGLEQSDKIVGAFQGYVLTYTEYLQSVFHYNMHVAELARVTGEM
ncbi:MAG: TolC family protein [Gammaproteobacteria bacterium]|nr:TolC family protein [Gammaproteobacteria bacterium]